jgi:DNA-binding transcriptional regulator YiaG
MQIESAIFEEARASRELLTPALRRALREGLGLSQARCARHFGVNRATYSRWESGARVPQGSALVQFVEFLHDLQEAAAK